MPVEGWRVFVGRRAAAEVEVGSAGQSDLLSRQRAISEVRHGACVASADTWFGSRVCVPEGRRTKRRKRLAARHDVGSAQHSNTGCDPPTSPSRPLSRVRLPCSPETRGLALRPTSLRRIQFHFHTGLGSRSGSAAKPCNCAAFWNASAHHLRLQASSTAASARQGISTSSSGASTS